MLNSTVELRISAAAAHLGTAHNSRLASVHCGMHRVIVCALRVSCGLGNLLSSLLVYISGQLIS